MPRALTEQEKCRLCQRLLEKGRDLLLIQGIKKISVDDITKAAAMAKGSFYHHFESKEKFLYELILDMRKQIFKEAEKFIKKENDKREYARNFLMNLFHMPHMKFFLKNCVDINELFNSMSDPADQKGHFTDADMFDDLLVLAGIDTQKIKSGIMHNYMHALFMMIECDHMIEDDLPETFDLIMDSLIQYIFGGVK